MKQPLTTTSTKCIGVTVACLFVGVAHAEIRPATCHEFANGLNHMNRARGHGVEYSVNQKLDFEHKCGVVNSDDIVPGGWQFDTATSEIISPTGVRGDASE
ncbi:hypothetical protein [Caballeronia concitans]|uniref:Lipoprotein n=1 Tax=Caballeronia concitans TaxID=1777133 RepID=A0A658QTA2_9BURK|nr:hypothetical protein [Caballeronia concitans]KIG10929.1 hypothetical protein BurMR1_1949 [Burkholderia sp. MR1]SAL18559.1 hypothetical protein AWB72_01224 [Caballeronia concitans]